MSPSRRAVPVPGLGRWPEPAASAARQHRAAAGADSDPPSESRSQDPGPMRQRRRRGLLGPTTGRGPGILKGRWRGPAVPRWRRRSDSGCCPAAAASESPHAAGRRRPRQILTWHHDAAPSHAPASMLDVAPGAVHASGTRCWSVIRVIDGGQQRLGGLGDAEPRS